MDQQQNTTNNLGTQPIGRLLVQLAVPSITAQLVNLLYNIVDRIFIGHIEGIGHIALTGVGLCLPVLTLISAFSALIGMGGAPQVSMKLGQKNIKQAENIIGSCFTVLIIISLLLTALFLIFARPLLFLFGASNETIPYSLSYLRIYVIGTVFVMITLGMNPFISAQGFAKISMMTTIIGALINIALDALFILGFNMGVSGAALATIIAQAVSALWVLRFLSGPKSTVRIYPKNCRINLKIITPVLALGLSPFIMQSTESLLNICFNTSLQKYGGDLAVGAMTILSSVIQICSLILVGLTQGAQPIISYNFGARNADRVRRAFRLLFTLAVSFSTAFWLFNQLLPRFFVSMFADNQSLIDIASWALHIYLGAIFMLGIQLSCQQTFVAIGQAKTSIFLALLRKIILLIPLIFILPHFFEDKVFAVFLAEPISDFIAASVTGLMFIYQFRRQLKSIAA